jgi:hypothetical protein
MWPGVTSTPSSRHTPPNAVVRIGWFGIGSGILGDADGVR